MNLVHWMRGYLALFSNITVKKIMIKIIHRSKYLQKQLRDCFLTTYTTFRARPLEELHNYFKGVTLDYSQLKHYPFFILSDYYINHRFNLLGSGWVRVKYGMDCPGLEGFRYRTNPKLKKNLESRWPGRRINSANTGESKRIRMLIDDYYIPIDWHLDFKSGYHWMERTYYKNIIYGHKPGVDVKVPWELSRMQHLPQLAFTYGLTLPNKNLDATNIYIKEFRNQILDFIADNPPRFGVNWSCTMDVAIRVTNWLIAFDLFRSFGAKFDNAFETIFMRSIYEHGVHIVNNLEWSPKLRSNHYLSDIAGLLFVAAYLPCMEITNAWLALAVQELISEVGSEFNADGSNFEGSTSYHRLSAEIVVYATALILGLPGEKQNVLRTSNRIPLKGNPELRPDSIRSFPIPGMAGLFAPFPAWYFERLEKMAEFTMHITKPDGYIPQFGDNDSGRFLKLQLANKAMNVAEAKSYYKNLDNYTGLPGDAVYIDENCTDHRHLVAAINGLFWRADFTAFTGRGYIETDIIRHLARNIKILSYLKADELTEAEKRHIVMEDEWHDFTRNWPLLSNEQREVMELPFVGESLLNGIKVYSYPDFGLFVYRSERLYLAARCGSIGQNGSGGHAHNDQLAIELNVDGRDVIVDPGTYLYTPLPEERNRYRSAMSHFSPKISGQEPAGFGQGLFRLAGGEAGKCVCLGENGFMGIYKNIKIFILIYADKIVWEARSSLGKPGWVWERVPCSDGYGKLRRW